MKERDNVKFFDMSGYKENAAARQRCTVSFLTDALKKRFPDDRFTVISAKINDSGVYQSRANTIEKALPFLSKISGLPSFCDVRIRVETGACSEEIIVWVPLCWNERFLGTAGGGTSTGGSGYFGRPDNTSRGTTVPYAVMNGFASATADAGNVNGFDDRMLDSETGELRLDLYENWRSRTTHDMARFGKAVTEILHARPISYSYLNGGSGGGRQCLVEVQEHPSDFDGVWASCPAINWCKFVPLGYFFSHVIRKHANSLTPKKIKHLSAAARNSVGGDSVYYTITDRISFDARQCIGEKTKRGVISENDAEAMNEIWDGPRSKNGERLWYSFRPGGTFWNVGIPVGAFYYTFLTHKPRPFYLSTVYLRWIKGLPKAKRKALEAEDFETLFEKSLQRFSDSAADRADLTEFAKHGKLMIDHGTDDPLIPVEGTLDYYRRVCQTLGREKTDAFFRLFIMPGDSHGNCRGKGGGMTASEGLTAIMKWAEQGKAPQTVRTVRVDLKGNTLGTGKQDVYMEPKD